MVEFKQIIGRGTRVRDDYDKYYFNILDYTGSATRLFADRDFDGEPAFVTEQEMNETGETIHEMITEQPTVSESEEEVARRSRMIRKACGGNFTSTAAKWRSPRIWFMNSIRMAGNFAWSGSPNTRRKKCARFTHPRPICVNSGPTRCCAPRSSRNWKSAVSISINCARRATSRKPIRSIFFAISLSTAHCGHGVSARTG